MDIISTSIIYYRVSLFNNVTIHDKGGEEKYL